MSRRDNRKKKENECDGNTIDDDSDFFFFVVYIYIYKNICVCVSGITVQEKYRRLHSDKRENLDIVNGLKAESQYI